VCLIHHVHTQQWDLYFPWLLARAGSTLEHRVMPAAYRRSEFVAVSPSTADELTRIGVDRARTHTITMGCDPAVRHREVSASATFLAVGRLVPHKRIDLLLELWEKVRPHTGGTLVIAGDGPERAALERDAGEHVVFRGFVSESEKAELLDQAWFLVHPAMHEGWGTVIMEAAAHGLPTLAFDVVGVRDSVRHGTSGMLAPDAAAFQRTWIELAADAGARRQLAAGSLRWAEEHTWERAIAAFVSVLETARAGAQ
jgi:glycosyltransferase involved in cell wall biosynthesis